MKRRSARPALALAVLLGLALALPSAAEETPADAALRERIESRLEALAEREGAEIQVRVSGGQVLLLGRVRVLEQSLRAEQATWRTPGVQDVENELRVLRWPEASDATVEQRVRTAIKGDERFLDARLEVEVASGFVRIRGLFQDPADVLALKHRIAAIPGVLALEIDARMVADAGRRAPPVARTGPASPLLASR